LRLNQYLARCGLGSRRACEAFVLAGSVTIDGSPVTELATTVNPGQEVRLDGVLVGREAFVYYLLYKPRGVLCSSRNERGRTTCVDLLDRVPERIYTVGRLDFDSEGLILLTNDGDLAQHMTHPSHHIEKEYEVEATPALDEAALSKIREGVESDGELLGVHTIELRPRGCCLVLKEGKNRQIRRIMEGVERRVKRLKRVRLGPVRDENLRSGQWRPLSPAELQELRVAAGLPT
jgi:23S rRNA pseudouridine2605 synthase